MKLAVILVSLLLVPMAPRQLAKVAPAAKQGYSVRDMWDKLPEADKKLAFVEGGDPYAPLEGTVQPKVTEIGMERTGCYGTCPVYSIEIASDGKFVYVGKRYVKKPGRHTGKIGPWEFRNLCRLVREIGFMKMGGDYFMSMTDGEHVYTTVVMDGKRKVVRNYNDAGPASLWALQELIDQALNRATWDADKASKPRQAPTSVPPLRPH